MSRYTIAIMQRCRAVAFGLFLTACGPKGGGVPAGSGATDNVDTTPPAQPVGSLPVDLVLSNTSGLVFFRADDDGLHEVRRVDLPDGIESKVWRTPEELYVSTVGDQLLVIRGGAVTPVELPPPAQWERPNAQDDDAVPVRMEDLYVDAEGNVWLGRCQWGQIYDGGYCQTWAYARVAPGPAGFVGPPAVKRDELAWIKPAPTGFRTARAPFQPPPDEDADEDAEAAPRDPVDRVRCEGPAGAVMIPDDEVASGPDFYGTEVGAWVAHEPPMLLVGWLYPGLGDYGVTWHLHRGCEAEAIVELEDVAFGPAGVWAYQALSAGWRVMLDGRELGVVPDDLYAPVFAPPRP